MTEGPKIIEFGNSKSFEQFYLDLQILQIRAVATTYPERPLDFAEALPDSTKNAFLKVLFMSREIAVMGVPFDINSGRIINKVAVF